MALIRPSLRSIRNTSATLVAAFIFMAIAPWVGQALAASKAPSGFTVVVCTSTGILYLPWTPEPASPTEGKADRSHLQTCTLCTTGLDSLGHDARPLGPIAWLNGDQVAFASAQSQWIAGHRWLPASPRAPPTV